ncbi:cytoskeletal protein RodZ [Roseovarius gaetbuli]|uniref:Cytoskeletal protein RodZ n=1 Tax=Roseovarius gaetbuli TaxID=1356575 RepID=A0A1X6Z9W7_9RHOB|nr:helix-turn-helix domain-containing protein [Roseovarius gaetbuli]SLN45063.1 cytoskeletal protein RodZ [Roseovarius gaetbuli]
MIGRRFTRTAEIKDVEARGFDAFELRLGDLMRGERATLGKSLLDVERELRIKATYVAAIENADPTAFDTPGFIPGYVRSYARYLGMDPDQAFKAFCAESGFSIAHGMSAEASSIRKTGTSAVRVTAKSSDPLISPNAPFLPATDTFLSRIEPGAIGSAFVLVALIGAIGYGGWSVLNQVQQVQLAPVENTPIVLADLDPLTSAGSVSDPSATATAEASGVFQPPRDERLSRLYRPKALDVPVMVARDAPISTLNPAEVGTMSPGTPSADRDSGFAVAQLDEVSGVTQNRPQVVADDMPDVRLVAVRAAWVRVRAADGSVIYEGILNAGESYDVPATQEPPTLRVGESGAVYFAVNGEHYGPAGPRGSVTSGLALTPSELQGRYAVADINADQDLMRYVAELQLAPASPALAAQD